MQNVFCSYVRKDKRLACSYIARHDDDVISSAGHDRFARSASVKLQPPTQAGMEKYETASVVLTRDVWPRSPLAVLLLNSTVSPNRYRDPRQYLIHNTRGLKSEISCFFVSI